MRRDEEVRPKVGKPDPGRRRSSGFSGPSCRVLLRFGPGAAFVLLIGLFLAFRLEPASTPLVPERDPGAARDDSIQVYFTAPDAGEVIRREAGLDRMLVGAMDQAQRSIDVAIYALNLGDVADALRRADQRGVRVRLVIESDNASEPEVQGLLGAGIAVREDGRPGLMHHKFVVIDSAEVWVGSMNLTLGAAFHDDNNMVRIGSPEVARDFTWEFDEMFEEDRFGALSLADTPKRRLIVGDVPLEVLFSPDDGAAERIEALIDAAEVSLEFAAFSLTSNAIADHILAAAARGVRVRGVMETSQVGGLGSEYERLEAAGLEVRLDGNPFNMHHKFLIIDAETVVTGSYNFTASAEERNDESVMVIHDRAIAEAFRDEFNRLLDVANGSP